MISTMSIISIRYEIFDYTNINVEYDINVKIFSFTKDPMAITQICIQLLSHTTILNKPPPTRMFVMIFYGFGSWEKLRFHSSFANENLLQYANRLKFNNPKSLSERTVNTEIFYPIVLFYCLGPIRNSYALL